MKLHEAGMHFMPATTGAGGVSFEASSGIFLWLLVSEHSW